MIATPDFYDRLENRSSASRENALFRDFRHILTISRPRVPALRAQLKGVDIAGLRTRADLAQIPVRRRAELPGLQSAVDPFGGLTATHIGKLRHLYQGADRVASIEGQAKDWWGAGRALYAAGLRKAMVVLNCFSYDLVPFGHMIESGAEAIGCPTVCAGNADIDAKCSAIAHYRPKFFCGHAEPLRHLLGRCIERRVDVSSMKHAFVAGPLPSGVRNEFKLRGLHVFQALITPELGPFAFESGTNEGLTINEGLIAEIVEQGTNTPAREGQPGEIVVSRVNRDYPLLRFGTGIVSSVVPRPSTCGRTNMRIHLPDDYRVDGSGNHEKRSNADLFSEIAKHWPGIGRMRWREPRQDGDAGRLVIEHCEGTDIKDRIADIVHRLTRTHAIIEFVEPGALADEDATKSDGRSNGLVV